MPIKKEKETPEFETGPIEMWANFALAVVMCILGIYIGWASPSLGADANFHLTHGISTSWLGICGVGVSIMATLLSWRGAGLNAIASYMTSVSVSMAILGSAEYVPNLSTLISISWLVAAIYFTRRFFEHNQFLSFVSLWGLTAASSFSSSIIYKLVFNHSYPLTGVLLLKAILFGLGGLTMLFAFPRKNKEYVI